MYIYLSYIAQGAISEDAEHTLRQGGAVRGHVVVGVEQGSEEGKPDQAVHIDEDETHDAHPQQRHP